MNALRAYSVGSGYNWGNKGTHSCGVPFEVGTGGTAVEEGLVGEVGGIDCALQGPMHSMERYPVAAEEAQSAIFND